jgi:hypothetical protein
MTRTLRSLTLLTALAAFGLTLTATDTAEARWGKRWKRGQKHGKRHHKHRGYALRCSWKLFHMPPQLLKDRMGLNDGQVAKILKYRNNMLFKKAAAKGKLATLKVKMRLEMEKDLPNLNTVLQLMRQMRSARGVKWEEKVKAKIWAMKVLSAEQRKQLRASCGRGKHHRKWRRWRHRRGPGKWRRGGPGMRHGPGAKKSSYDADRTVRDPLSL